MICSICCWVVKDDSWGETARVHGWTVMREDVKKCTCQSPAWTGCYRVQQIRELLQSSCLRTKLFLSSTRYLKGFSVSNTFKLCAYMEFVMQSVLCLELVICWHQLSSFLTWHVSLVQCVTLTLNLCISIDQPVISFLKCQKIEKT